MGQGAAADAEAIHFDPESLKHGDVKIAQWLFVEAGGGVLFVLTVFEPTACEDDGQIGIGVGVGIGHAAAEQRHAVIE